MYCKSLHTELAPGKVGGKAYNLSVMIQHGYPVPPGFVVEAEAFEEYSRGGIFPAALAAEISSFTEGISAKKYMVRSSALGEDSEENSFAGQLESFISAPDTESLTACIISCWNSYHNEHLKVYQETTGHYLKGMGVVIQELIDPDYAGVLFTRSPLMAGQMMGEYVEGHGEKLVSGRVSPERFHCERKSGMADKTLPFCIEKMHATATELEKDFGQALDIEWVFREGHFYLVQCRPVTTLAKGPRVYWSNTNVNENYPEAISPLLYSVARESYYHYFKTLSQLLRVPPEKILSLEGAYSNVIGIFGCRMYYNMSSIHSIIMASPFSGLLRKSFDHFVGYQGKEGSVDETGISNLGNKQNIGINGNTVNKSNTGNIGNNDHICHTVNTYNPVNLKDVRDMGDSQTSHILNEPGNSGNTCNLLKGEGINNTCNIGNTGNNGATENIRNTGNINNTGESGNHSNRINSRNDRNKDNNHNFINITNNSNFYNVSNTENTSSISNSFNERNIGNHSNSGGSCFPDNRHNLIILSNTGNDVNKGNTDNTNIFRNDRITDNIGSVDEIHRRSSQRSQSDTDNTGNTLNTGSAGNTRNEHGNHDKSSQNNQIDTYNTGNISNTGKADNDHDSHQRRSQKNPCEMHNTDNISNTGECSNQSDLNNHRNSDSRSNKSTPGNHFGRLRERLLFSTEFLRLNFRLKKNVKAFEKRADRYRQEVDSAYELKELSDCFYQFQEIRMHSWYKASCADFFAMVYHGVLGVFCKRYYPDGYEGIRNQLIQAIPGLISNKPVTETWKIIRLISDNGPMFRLLQNATAEEFLGELKKGKAPAIQEAIESYLQDWGFRCSGELMLTKPGYIEQPAQFIRLLQQYSRLPQNDPEGIIAQKFIERKKIFNNFVSRLWRKRGLLFPLAFLEILLLRLLVNLCSQGIACRERVRLKQAMIYYQFRVVLLKTGKIFRKKGWLEEAEDIFFLRFKEIGEQLNGSDMLPQQLKMVVGLRKSQFEKNKTLVYPDDFSTYMGEYPLPGQVMKEEAAPAGSGNKISGLSACGGYITGTARVLESIMEAHKLEPGDILVTRQTDPGWAGIFPLISGLIVERGGMLSHGAIVAREFGIPAIVGVHLATELIQDGDEIVLNADKGEIYKKAKAEDFPAVEKPATHTENREVLNDD